MIDAELIKHADDHAANVVARAIGGLQGGEHEVERAFWVAIVERGECLAQVRAPGSLERDPRRQPVGGETAWDPCEQRQRIVVLAACVEDPRQRQRRVGPIGLEFECAPQRVLVTRLDQRIDLGGDERIEEPLDRQSAAARRRTRRPPRRRGTP